MNNLLLGWQLALVVSLIIALILVISWMKHRAKTLKEKKPDQPVWNATAVFGVSFYLLLATISLLPTVHAVVNTAWLFAESGFAPFEKELSTKFFIWRGTAVVLGLSVSYFTLTMLAVSFAHGLVDILGSYRNPEGGPGMLTGARVNESETPNLSGTVYAVAVSIIWVGFAVTGTEYEPPGALLAILCWLTVYGCDDAYIVSTALFHSEGRVPKRVLKRVRRTNMLVGLLIVLTAFSMAWWIGVIASFLSLLSSAQLFFGIDDVTHRDVCTFRDWSNRESRQAYLGALVADGLMGLIENEEEVPGVVAILASERVGKAQVISILEKVIEELRLAGGGQEPTPS